MIVSKIVVLEEIAHDSFVIQKFANKTVRITPSASYSVAVGAIVHKRLR